MGSHEFSKVLAVSFLKNCFAPNSMMCLLYLTFQYTTCSVAILLFWYTIVSGWLVAGNIRLLRLEKFIYEIDSMVCPKEQCYYRASYV